MSIGSTHVLIAGVGGREPLWHFLVTQGILNLQPMNSIHTLWSTTNRWHVQYDCMEKTITCKKPHRCPELHKQREHHRAVCMWLERFPSLFPRTTRRKPLCGSGVASHQFERKARARFACQGGMKTCERASDLASKVGCMSFTRTKASYT